MSSTKTVTLYTGAKMPLIGLGTYKPAEEAGKAVKFALELGYRHIDTAYFYQNEKEVGQGIKDSKVPREQIFVTSKLWNTFHHPERVEKAFNKSLNDLQLDYLDLYLIHWPYAQPQGSGLLPKNPDNTPILEEGYTIIDTWRQMEKLVESGKTKHIGLSNFDIEGIKNILAHAKIRPAVLQVEMHPYLPQTELLEYCKQENIHITAYTPLGSEFKPVLREDVEIGKIANEIGSTVSQVLLSWGQQRGTTVIPRSTNEQRIKKNLETIKLSDEAMDKVSNLGVNRRFNGFEVLLSVITF